MNCIRCQYIAAEDTLDSPAFSCRVPEQYGHPLRQHPRRNLILGIRPEDLLVETEYTAAAKPARVYVSEPMGKETLLTVDANGTLLKATTPPSSAFRSAILVWLRFDERAVRLFDEDTERRSPLTCRRRLPKDWRKSEWQPTRTRPAQGWISSSFPTRTGTASGTGLSRPSGCASSR